MIEIDTPGFLLTRKTATILSTSIPTSMVKPMFVGASIALEQNRYQLSRGYNNQGQPIELSRDVRGTHQAHPGYEVLDFNEWLQPVLNEYVMNNFFASDRRVVKTQEYYLWYEPGAGISLHADDSTANSTNTFYRVVTVLLYLNDDYEGGEISFPAQGLTKKPSPGDLLIFPGNKAFKHVVAPIVSGHRYALMQTYDLPLLEGCCP